KMDTKTLTSTLVLTFLMTAPAAMATEASSDTIQKPTSVTQDAPSTTPSRSWFSILTGGFFDEHLSTSSASSSQVDESRITYRTTDENKEAKNKHSAIQIQLSNEDLQANPPYTLVVNHRTTKTGPEVKIRDPNTQEYSKLGTLPSSSDFSDTTFDLSDWVKTTRDGFPVDSVITTYLSFANGKSDIHSFTLRSGDKILKEVIFGNQASESQPGIRVYAPETETDKNSNEWSKAKYDDVKQ
ncbi:hypothetical protein K2X05_09655, partial [bacterium]|nr:hypothetical protein [bacterium]